MISLLIILGLAVVVLGYTTFNLLKKRDIYAKNHGYSKNLSY